MNLDSELAKFIKDYKNVPFEWGINDCMSFSAEWGKRCTGIDYRAKFQQGEYNTPEGAMKVLLKNGFQSPEQLLDSLFKRQRKTRVMRGDIIGHHFYENFMSVGINMAEKSLFLHTDGLIFVPSNIIEYHWELKYA